MKTITIEIVAATPEDVAEALDDIKQAIFLGNDSYKPNSGRYDFRSKGDYEA